MEQFNDYSNDSEYLLSKALEGTLSSSEEATLQTMLQSSAELRSEYDVLMSTQHLLTRRAATQSLQTQNFRDQVRATIEQSLHTPPSPLGTLGSTAVILGITAVLITGVWLVLRPSSPDPSPALTSAPPAIVHSDSIVVQDSPAVPDVQPGTPPRQTTRGVIENKRDEHIQKQITTMKLQMDAAVTSNDFHTAAVCAHRIATLYSAMDKAARAEEYRKKAEKYERSGREHHSERARD